MSNEQQVTPALKVGDVVQRMGSNRLMTIEVLPEDTEDGVVHVVYYDYEERHFARATFQPDELELTQTTLHTETHGDGVSALSLKVFHVVSDRPGREYVAHFDQLEPMGGAPSDESLTFQRGNPHAHGVNGWTNEALLAVLIHRTETLNAQFQCGENVKAIAHMAAAMAEFHARTAARKASGVEGSMQA